MCASVYHQLLNPQGGTYDYRVDASAWDWINCAPQSALRRESTEAGIAVLQSFYLFYTMLNVFQDVKCLLVTIWG
jgi:hypothetical protein